MLTSLYTALSALHANSTAISVVGNNLANLNTNGYKTSNLYFRDLVTRSIGGNGAEVGFGTAQPQTIRCFSQGAIQSSSSDLDAAVQGQGFFVLKDNTGGTSFTRAGSFHTDASGQLRSISGESVQGWMVDPSTGQIDSNAPIGDISVAVGSLRPPTPTSKLSLNLNLDSSADVTTKADLSYPVQVYDTLGNVHALTFDFTKSAENDWTYSVSIPGAELTTGTPGTPSVLATGHLTFGADGKLTLPAAGDTIDIPIAGLASGAKDQTLKWDPYSGTAGRITQFSGSSSVSASSQDGSASAQIVRVSLSDGGKVLAEYSDQQQLMVGQLAMASICNPDSLAAQGGNTYRATSATATPVIGLPETGGRGKIVGGSVEASNADVATEFMNLIVYQRAYQANSRVVTSTDQISQETINLIR
jgi:flagellar hook protein FlgE